MTHQVCIISIHPELTELPNKPVDTPTHTQNMNRAQIVFINIPLFSSRYNTKINTSFKKSHLKQRNCTKNANIYYSLITEQSTVQKRH